MHTWAVIAFLLFAVAAVVFALDKAWPHALLAAGLAAYIVPIVFELSS